MKWWVTILLVTAALVAYLWWPDGAPPQNELNQPTSAALPSEKSPLSEAGSITAPAEDTVSMVDPEQQAAAEELESEIKNLMADFERYRHDEERRKQIQSEIDDLMAEYNELILPIALSKIKEGN